MSRSPSSPVAAGSGQPDPVRAIFLATLWRVIGVWLMVAVAMAVGLWFWAGHLLADAVVIAVASGLISVVAVVPGITLPASPSKAAMRVQMFVIGGVAAMAIRVVGTVALLVACRYQLGLPAEVLAICICGWYVLLTFVEVVSLARGGMSLTVLSGAMVPGWLVAAGVLSEVSSENLSMS